MAETVFLEDVCNDLRYQGHRLFDRLNACTSFVDDELRRTEAQSRRKNHWKDDKPQIDELLKNRIALLQDTKIALEALRSQFRPQPKEEERIVGLDYLNHLKDNPDTEYHPPKFPSAEDVLKEMATVRAIISQLDEELPQEDRLLKGIPEEDIIAAAAAQGLSKEQTLQAIERLKRSADCFSPAHGYVAKL